MRWKIRVSSKVTTTKIMLLTFLVCSFVFSYALRSPNERTPLMSELTKTGPYKIELVRGRTSGVSFISLNKSEESYFLPQHYFNPKIKIFDLIHKLRKQGAISGYLWVYEPNKLMKVWRADIQDINVLSYEEARKVSLVDPKIRRGATLCAYFFALMLTLSFFRIDTKVKE